LAFQNKIVGLVLIASPSYGARWANRLKLLSRLYKQKMGAQLEWKSWSLEDLDRRFKALIKEKRIPGLDGEEACEHHFILHRWWWPWNPIVLVSVESAGRYFGPAQTLAGTDHFTCVKPDSRRHPAFEFVGDFCRKLSAVKLPAPPPPSPPSVRVEVRSEPSPIIRPTDKDVRVYDTKLQKLLETLPVVYKGGERSWMFLPILIFILTGVFALLVYFKWLLNF